MTKDSLIRRWNHFFFDTIEPESFELYFRIIFTYIFLFVGHSVDIKGEVVLNWEPISFFKFLSAKHWTQLAYISFFMLKASSLMILLNVYRSFLCKLCFLAAAINLGYYCNFGKVNHTFQLLVITIGLVSLVPQRYSKKDLWPIVLIKLYASSIYFVAGLNKLTTGGMDWVFSENFYRRLIIHPGKTNLSQWIIERGVSLSIFLAFGIIFLFQIPAILAPFNKYTGYYLFCCALLFHLGSQLLFLGHLGYISYVICLTIFLPLNKVMHFLGPWWMGLRQARAEMP